MPHTQTNTFQINKQTPKERQTNMTIHICHTYVTMIEIKNQLLIVSFLFFIKFYVRNLITNLKTQNQSYLSNELMKETEGSKSI